MYMHVKHVLFQEFKIAYINNYIFVYLQSEIIELTCYNNILVLLLK